MMMMDRRQCLSTVFDFFISTIEPGWYIQPLYTHTNIYWVSKNMMTAPVERGVGGILIYWKKERVRGGTGEEAERCGGKGSTPRASMYVRGSRPRRRDDGWWLLKDGKWFILSARRTHGGREKEYSVHYNISISSYRIVCVCVHDWQVEPSGGSDVDWWSLPAVRSIMSCAHLLSSAVHSSHTPSPTPACRPISLTHLAGSL